MSSINVAVALCLLLTVCGAAKLGKENQLNLPEATPQPCCTPPVYEGNLSVVAVTGGDVAFVSGSYHFDLRNKRVAAIEMVYAGGRLTRVNVVETAQAMYVIMPDMKQCQKLPAVPINNCMSKTAKFALTMRMGGIGPYLDMNIFQIASNGSLPVASIAVTKENCVYLSSTVITATGIKEQVTLSNLHASIKDPSVFNIPAYCNKMDAAPLPSVAQSSLSWHMMTRMPFL